ncbi:hypothetical protein G6L46_10225 [Agrobacterium rhizogenes]|uniref:hypothetical protein n=1 Tax=Rhizobium rhizogenes TaxID=359 RepID=UPI001571DF5C|nr:hypothetical protein [Rhizobium rhizogenes]NTF87500.1 hypothetical protein [Rhizobium rhizogenes]
MDWDAALANMEAVCADVFDTTPCRIIGRVVSQSVNHRRQDDPARPAFDFLGTFELEPPSTKIWRHLSPDPGDMGNRSDTVSYDALLTAHTGAWPWIAERGDLVEVSGQRWKIAAISQDGTVRPAFFLVRP